MTFTTPHTVARSLAVCISVTALTLAGPTVATAKSANSPAIPLNAGQETPKANSGASGFFSYSVDGDQLCYTLSVRNLSAAAAAAHVHFAPRNVAGGVVVPLSVGVGTSWSTSTCTTADAGLLAAIESAPRDYYVNVHTSTFPSGEIRGQLK